MTTTNTRTAKSWLWPDRTIGKMESRVLRDEHNALVNEVATLRARCERLEAALKGCAAALKEAGKDFALASPRAARPNLYELHAEVAVKALAGEGK